MVVVVTVSVSVVVVVEVLVWVTAVSGMVVVVGLLIKDVRADVVTDT